MRSTNSREGQEAKFRAMRRGFEERMGRSPRPVLVHGERLTREGIRDRLVAIGEAHEAVSKAKAKYEEALRVLRGTEAEDEHFRVGLERLLRQLYNRRPEQLRHFGL